MKTNWFLNDVLLDLSLYSVIICLYVVASERLPFYLLGLTFIIAVGIRVLDKRLRAEHPEMFYGGKK